MEEARREYNNLPDKLLCWRKGKIGCRVVCETCNESCTDGFTHVPPGLYTPHDCDCHKDDDLGQMRFYCYMCGVDKISNFDHYDLDHSCLADEICYIPTLTKKMPPWRNAKKATQ
jgi:hypothetical protein